MKQHREEERLKKAKKHKKFNENRVDMESSEIPSEDEEMTINDDAEEKSIEISDDVSVMTETIVANRLTEEENTVNADVVTTETIDADVVTKETINADVVTKETIDADVVIEETINTYRRSYRGD